MSESTSKFPHQLFSFFRRYTDQNIDDEALSLLQKLYAQLQAGHASVQIQPSWNKTIKSLEEQKIVGPTNENYPIVRTDEGNLYFRRYYKYEANLAKRLIHWSNQQNHSESQINPNIIECLKDSLDQLQAAKLAVQNSFAVITGGPGTGKTYLLVAILANLLKQNPDLKISLVAPTGKAAQRMTESIQANIHLFPLTEEEKINFPKYASTIHRLLRSLPPSIHFRKNKDSQLNADFVIVDEASMVDLPLMSKLVESIKPNSRLLLIGDINAHITTAINGLLATAYWFACDI